MMRRILALSLLVLTLAAASLTCTQAHPDHDKNDCNPSGQRSGLC
jgi:hypothetical protein